MAALGVRAAMVTPAPEVLGALGVMGVMGTRATLALAAAAGAAVGVAAVGAAALLTALAVLPALGVRVALGALGALAAAESASSSGTHNGGNMSYAYAEIDRETNRVRCIGHAPFLPDFGPAVPIYCIDTTGMEPPPAPGSVYDAGTGEFGEPEPEPEADLDGGE
jgi:hypothetical protein